MNYQFNWSGHSSRPRFMECPGVGEVWEDPLGSQQWWGLVYPDVDKIGPFPTKDAAQNAVQIEWILRNP